MSSRIPWALIIVLLLSVGINIGFFARLFVSGPPASGPPESAGTSLESAGTSSTSPEEPSQDPPKEFARIFQRMADGLRLEGELRETFLERQRRFFRDSVTARQQIRRVQGELRRELLAESTDRGRIDTLLVQSSEARVELERVFIDNLLDCREFLDPERERRFLRMMTRLRQERERRIGER